MSRRWGFARLCKIKIRILQSVERMSETFGRLLRVIRGRRTRKSKLSRLIGMRVSRYCLLTKFLMRIYDNERPSRRLSIAPWPFDLSRGRGSQCLKHLFFSHFIVIAHLPLYLRKNLYMIISIL